MAARRVLSRRAAVSLGEEHPISVGEFVDSVRDGRWFKVIAAGDTVSASVSAPAGRGVIFCETDSAAGGISRVRYFAGG
jgi:hypothetical protein